MGKDWQSCHTPLPAITSPTNNRAFNGGGWIRQGKMGKSKQGGDTWIFSHGSRFDNSPTLILVKIMPLLNLVATNIAGWVHLIKDAYLHANKT